MLSQDYLMNAGRLNCLTAVIAIKGWDEYLGVHRDDLNDVLLHSKYMADDSYCVLRDVEGFVRHSTALRS